MSATSSKAGWSPTRACPPRSSATFLSREQSRVMLCTGHRVPHRQDRDGRQHRHLPRLAIPPLRQRQRRLGTPAGAAGEPARRRDRPTDRATAGLSTGGLRGHDLRGKAVLVHTGWDAHWRTDQYFEGHPFLTADAAELPREAGRGARGHRLAQHRRHGRHGPARPYHAARGRDSRRRASHGLAHLPEADFRFFAVPVKVKGMGTFPVRAFGLV